MTAMLSGPGAPACTRNLVRSALANLSDETVYSYVTVLENATTGAVIDSCAGCDVVRADGTAASALG